MSKHQKKAKIDFSLLEPVDELTEEEQLLHDELRAGRYTVINDPVEVARILGTDVKQSSKATKPKKILKKVYSAFKKQKIR